MTDEQRDILRHALGLGLNSGDAYEPTRNYYADEPDARDCNALVIQGAMIKGRVMDGGLQLYHVTDLGLRVAVKPIGWDN